MNGFPRAWLIVAAAVIIGLLAISNLPWQLDDYDQAKQAFTSWQLIKEGRVFYQQTPSGKVATKPPLVGWVSASIYSVTHSWDLAWHLPSFAAALGLIYLLYRAARPLGELPTLLAFLAFTLNILTRRIATLVRTDMPLALVIFAIGLLFLKHIRSRSPWNGRDRFLLFLLLTATMFIKGPIVYAFILPGLVCYEIRRRWRPDFPPAWSGSWPWLASIALFLSWVIVGIRQVPGFYNEVVVTEFAGRFSETVHRSQSLFFYLPHLVQKFAPWSLLMILLAIVTWRRARAATGRGWERAAAETFWVAAWAFGGIAVMSLIPSKRVDRIFPAIAPLALLLAMQARRLLQFQDWAAPLRRLTVAAVIFASLYTGGYAVANVVMGYRHDRDALVRFGQDVRQLADREHLKVEVLRSDDEGLPMYLDRPGFVRDIPAGIDAIVRPMEKRAQEDTGTVRLQVKKGGEHPARYGFFMLPRSGPPK